MSAGRAEWVDPSEEGWRPSSGETPAAMKVVALDLTDPATASELLDLQRRAYRVEAGLIGSTEIPSLHESLEELQDCGETFLGAFVVDRLAGCVSWKFDGETIDLHRLVVDPPHFRSGVGTALVRTALAANPGAMRAIVQTGAGNEPARALYLREGFTLTDEFEPIPGLWVARFSKQLRLSAHPMREPTDEQTD
jgi:GNAT superfamily N-acetyltransferase